MNANSYDVIFVGGGAAGLMGACLIASTGLKIAVIEKNSRPGSKILITGKGRCNITNMSLWDDFSSHIHPDASFFKKAFFDFSNTDVRDFFESLGVATVEERGKRLFPASGRSATVRDALQACLERGNVEILCNTEVENVRSLGKGSFALDVISHQSLVSVIYGRTVVLTTGGLSYPSTGSTGAGYTISSSFGHSIVKTLPSLTALTPKRYDVSLAGIDLENVKLELYVDGLLRRCELGDMSFTEGGMEGSIGFRLSREAVLSLDKGSEVALVLDLKPGLSLEKLRDRITREYDPSRPLSKYLLKLMPGALVAPFMRANTDLSPMNLPVRLKEWRFPIGGYVGYQRCVVTQGGVSLKEVSRKTMESKKCSGLYIAGELLNLDADTGGYNLQIAFSTGVLAARSAVASILSQD
ncbi:MAG: aminoacetone oxidase family FAD-binding enzyme [Bacteroidales bacterium]|nr:aminoacetone oxidase family FAD-binding enzyme [Bacteroidales bacterium]